MSGETAIASSPAVAASALDPRRHSGKVVLITGAAGGFGRAAAIRFAREGAILALSDLPGAGLERISTECGGQAFACDVTDETSVVALVSAVAERFGRIDIAINNAGVAHPFTTIEETDLATFDHMIAVNLKGVFLCLRSELAAMREAGGGVILNVASVAGVAGAPGLGAYAASKHGVVGLTRTAAVEAARHNIRVNALCPSYADTDMVSGITERMEGTREETSGQLVRGIPMRRLARAEEVAAAMSWMTSDENTFMTGHELILDGGGTAS